MGKLLKIREKTKSFMQSIWFGVAISIVTLISFIVDSSAFGYFSFSIIALLILVVGSDFRNIIPLLFLFFGCWKHNPFPIPSPQFYFLVGILSFDGIIFGVRLFTTFKENLLKLKKDYLFYSLLAIIGAMLLSLINTPRMDLSWTGIGYQAAITFAYFVVRVTVPSDEDSKKTIVESIIVTGILISFQTIYMLLYRLSNGQDIAFILWMKTLSFGWAHSNHYTSIVNISMLLAVYYFCKYRNIKNRVFSIVGLLLFCFVNAITVCRAGYLSIIPTLLISVIIYFVYNKKFLKASIKKDVFYLIPFVLSAVVGIIVLLKIGYLQEITAHLKDMGLSDNNRNHVFSIGWEQFLAHPIIGSGAYTSRHFIEDGFNTWNYHNYIIQMLGTCGIVGLLTFLVYLGFSIKRTLNKDLYSAFVGVVILYFLIHGLMDTLYFNHLIMTLVCVLQAVQVKDTKIAVSENLGESGSNMDKIIVNGKFLTQRVTGVQRVAYEMLKELDKDIEDGMVEIACPKDTKKIPEYEHIRVVKVGKLKGNLWEQISFPRYVRKTKGVALSLCNSAPLLNTGYITIHDAKVRRHPEYYSKKFILWYNFMFKRILKRSIHIFTNSVFSRDEISECFRIDKNKFTIGYLGWQHYNSISYDENTLNKYNLEKEKYFFAMGSMDPTKNFKWIAENAKNNPNYTFAIAGSINNTVFSNKMGFECPNNVKLLGFVSDAEAKTLMRDSVAFLFPSHYEGFGIPPLEAMSAGCKRVITSDTTIMHELFGDYVTYIDPLKYDYDMNTLINGEEKDFKEILDKFSWKVTEEAFYNVIFRK